MPTINCPRTHDSLYGYTSLHSCRVVHPTKLSSSSNKDSRHLLRKRCTTARLYLDRYIARYPVRIQFTWTEVMLHNNCNTTNYQQIICNICNICNRTIHKRCMPHNATSQHRPRTYWSTYCNKIPTYLPLWYWFPPALGLLTMISQLGHGTWIMWLLITLWIQLQLGSWLL